MADAKTCTAGHPFPRAARRVTPRLIYYGGVRNAAPEPLGPWVDPGSRARKRSLKESGVISVYMRYVSRARAVEEHEGGVSASRETVPRMKDISGAGTVVLGRSLGWNLNRGES